MAKPKGQNWLEHLEDDAIEASRRLAQRASRYVRQHFRERRRGEPGLLDRAVAFLAAVRSVPPPPRPDPDEDADDCRRGHDAGQDTGTIDDLFRDPAPSAVVPEEIGGAGLSEAERSERAEALAFVGFCARESIPVEYAEWFYLCALSGSWVATEADDLLGVRIDPGFGIGDELRDERAITLRFGARMRDVDLVEMLRAAVAPSDGERHWTTWPRAQDSLAVTYLWCDLAHVLQECFGELASESNVVTLWHERACPRRVHRHADLAFHGDASVPNCTDATRGTLRAMLERSKPWMAYVQAELAREREHALRRVPTSAQ